MAALAVTTAPGVVLLPACPVLEDMARRALALLAPGELAAAAEGEALEALAVVLGGEGG